MAHSAWRTGHEAHSGSGGERRGEYAGKLSLVEMTVGDGAHAPAAHGGASHALVEMTVGDGAHAPAAHGGASHGQEVQRKPAPSGSADGSPPVDALIAAIGATPVLIDDDSAARPGQIAKLAFIAQLKPQLEEAAAAELGASFATAGCPHIAHYLAIYATRAARDGEAFIRRFTGSQATTATELMADLLVRVRAGVRSWRETGQVPLDVTAAAGGSIPAPGGVAAPAGQHQDDAGAALTAPAGTPAAVLTQLGEGAPLDGVTRAQMDAAVGTSFADVRVHADAKGAALASQHGALAFTVGAHIAVAAGRYAPGTLEGDALLAHELTHVLQQRGAAPSSATTNTATGQDASAEHDADQGAEAAMRHLHGSAADKAKQGKAKQRADYQLQRCVGTAEAPTLDAGVLHRNVYTWDGDPFAVLLEYHPGKPIGGSPTPGWLEFQAKYAGGDDSNGEIARMSIGQLQPGKGVTPALSFDRSDGWTKLTVDLYGDGAWLGEIHHATTRTAGWTPNTRTHTFEGSHGDQPFAPAHPVTVKSKDAVPAAGHDQPASDEAAPSASVRVDLAATVAQRQLDDLLGDPNLQLDPKAAPWAALKSKLDAAATKHRATTTDDPAEGARLTRVGDAMHRARPMLIALGAASHQEAFLPDIAEACLALVEGSRAQFVAAIGAAWDGDASAVMQAAMHGFEVMWYRVSALYLAQGQGAGTLLERARSTAQEVLLLSDRASMGAPKLQAALGVVTGPPTGADMITQKNRELAQVRAGFMAGRPGSLGEVTKIRRTRKWRRSARSTPRRCRPTCKPATRR